MALQTDTIFQFQDPQDPGFMFENAAVNSKSALNISTESTSSDSIHAGESSSRFITSLLNQKTEISPNLIPETHISWLMVVLTGCLLLLAIIRFTRKKLLPNLFQSLQSSKPALQSDVQAVPAILLFLFSIVVYSVFTIILLQKFKLHDTGIGNFTIGQFIVVPAMFACLFIIQFLFTRITGFIFNTRRISKKYVTSSFAYNSITAILLLPVLMISAYDRSLTSIYLAIGLIALLFIAKLIKGTFLFRDERKYSLYHFFTYFCTLEILPILIIIKAIVIAKQL